MENKPKKIRMHKKLRVGRGLRGGKGEASILANTRQIKRILNYMKEINKPICQTTVAREVMISGASAKDAIRFLIGINMIKGFVPKSNISRSIYYELNSTHKN